MNATIVRTDMTSPLVKWAGGKRQLIKELIKRVPSEIGNYFEPFLGGGAMFFALSEKQNLDGSILSDINPDLYNLYSTVQKTPALLWKTLENLNYKNLESDFYEARERFNSQAGNNENLTRASLFLYLNRHCYNGLFRVNSQGAFNVPFGKYNNPGMPDQAKILEVSNALQNAKILNLDFREALEGVAEGDFVYLDPPYFPISSTSNFTDYSREKFGLSEQERLANTFRELDKKNAKVMLSNSAAPSIIDLYEGYKLDFLGANRMINSNPTGRGKIKELIVTNF